MENPQPSEPVSSEKYRIAVLFRDKQLLAEVLLALSGKKISNDVSCLVGKPEEFLSAATSAAKEGRPYNVIITESSGDSSDYLDANQFADAVKRKKTLSPVVLLVYKLRISPPEGTSVRTIIESPFLDGYIDRSQSAEEGRSVHDGLANLLSAGDFVPLLTAGKYDELKNRFPFLHFYDKPKPEGSEGEKDGAAPGNP